MIVFEKWKIMLIGAVIAAGVILALPNILGVKMTAQAIWPIALISALTFRAALIFSLMLKWMK